MRLLWLENSVICILFLSFNTYCEAVEFIEVHSRYTLLPRKELNHHARLFQDDDHPHRQCFIIF